MVGVTRKVWKRLKHEKNDFLRFYYFDIHSGWPCTISNRVLKACSMKTVAKSNDSYSLWCHRMCAVSGSLLWHLWLQFTLRHLRFASRLATIHHLQYHSVWSSFVPKLRTYALTCDKLTDGPGLYWYGTWWILGREETWAMWQPLFWLREALCKDTACSNRM